MVFITALDVEVDVQRNPDASVQNSFVPEVGNVATFFQVDNSVITVVDFVYHALTMAGSNFLNSVKNNQNAYNTSDNVVLNKSFFDMLNSDISTTYDLDW